MEVVAMKGTEKQIKWAEEIMTKIESTRDDFTARMRAAKDYTPELESKLNEKIDTAISEFKNEGAGYIIQELRYCTNIREMVVHYNMLKKTHQWDQRRY